MPTLPTQALPLTDAECPASIDEKGAEIKPVRLHVHAYFHFGKRVHVRHSDAFMLLGSHPVLSSVTASAGGRTRSRGNQGLYYVQAPKFGRCGRPKAGDEGGNGSR